MQELKRGPDRVVTVAVWLREEGAQEESFKELGDLVEAAGGDLVGSLTQTLDAYRPATLIGRGKLKEVKDFVQANDIDLVIFDQDLTGVQMRNIEDELECGVLDRTGLILDIFASRAKTREGKLQVHLAQLAYRLTHLIGMKNLSRLAGGIGTRGPGEQKLETDRRHIRRLMDRIRVQLDQVKSQRATGRKRRLKSRIPLASLVGYTNAGKSSLMNRMIKEGNTGGRQVQVRDMPFVTLDSSLRQISLPQGLDLVLSDTVGFISNLPTDLVEAFYSTLEEISYADLLIHVLDGSRGDLQLQYDTTWKILQDLEVLDIPSILVINKMDLVDQGRLPLVTHGEDVVYLSVKKDEDIGVLYDMMEEKLTQDYVETELNFSYQDQDVLNQVLNRYEALDLKYGEEGIYLRVDLAPEDAKSLKDYQGGDNV